MILLDTAPSPAPEPQKGGDKASSRFELEKVRAYVESIRGELKRVKHWVSNNLPRVEGDLSTLASIVEQRERKKEKRRLARSQKQRCASGFPADFDWEMLEIE